jgi:hypothetical protein
MFMKFKNKFIVILQDMGILNLIQIQTGLDLKIFILIQLFLFLFCYSSNISKNMGCFFANQQCFTFYLCTVLF